MEVEIEEPEPLEVMDLTAEPSAQPVRDRRLAPNEANLDFPSEANLTTQYLESIGVYDDDDVSSSSS